MGNMQKVCTKAFSSITSISKRRFNIINKEFMLAHSSPVEKRGGIDKILLKKK